MNKSILIRVKILPLVLIFALSGLLPNLFSPVTVTAQSDAQLDSEAEKACRDAGVTLYLSYCKDGYKYAVRGEPESKCGSGPVADVCKTGYNRGKFRINNINNVPSLVPTGSLDPKYADTTHKVQRDAAKFCENLYKGDNSSAELNRSKCRGDYVQGVINDCIRGNPSVRKFEECTKDKVAEVEKKLKAEASPENPEEEDECKQGGFDLTWIICPIIELTRVFAEKIFSELIQPMLENIPISTDSNNGGYKSWQGFRLMANVMLLGAMLILVYGMLRGGGGR